MACQRYTLNSIPVEIWLVLSTILRKCDIRSSHLLIMHSSMHRFGTLLQFCAAGPDITVCVVWSPVDTALPLLALPPTDITQLFAISLLALHVHWHTPLYCQQAHG